MDWGWCFAEEPMPEQADDFPAAHSMDTSWFAVDGSGNIGLFTSHEHGPVPQALGEQDIDALIESMVTRCPLVFWNTHMSLGQHCDRNVGDMILFLHAPVESLPDPDYGST